MSHTAKWGWAAAAATVAAQLATPGSADDVGARVRREGLLRCAAVERPGYAEIEDDKPGGRAAELCRTVAEAVLGPHGRFALRLLDLDSDFDRLRDGKIELAFLEPRRVVEHRLGPVLVSIGVAYEDRFAVLLPQGAAPQTLAELQGQTICFMTGDPVWPLLAGALADRHVAFRPFGFSEEVEMRDAYTVGGCDAMAGLTSALEALRTNAGVKHLQSRLLFESLGPDPVDALVPSGDAAWADTVRASLTKVSGPPR